MEVPQIDKDVVDAIRSALATRIGKERFDLWFGSGVEFSAEGNRLVLQADSQFLLDRICKGFQHELEAVQSEILASQAAVQFRLLAASPRGNSESPSDSIHSIANSNDGENEAQSSPRRQRSPAKQQKGRRFSSLDSFVVGPSNCVAHASAMMLLKRPGSVSPCFVCGPSGTGKTHLLEGIWGAVRRRKDIRRVVYLSAEQFTTYFLEALHGTGLPSFRRKYRDVDVLLVDDLQFFAGKRATLSEFHYTIDSLLREGKQLVLAADQPPVGLQALGSELMTRVTGGLVCQLEYPDRDTRLKILRQLATSRGMEVPNDVIKLVAQELVGDTRQLSGALNRLEATSAALDKPITVNLATSALEDLLQAQSRVVRITDVEQAVCDVFGLEKETLKSNRKAKAITQPRMLAMWLSRKYTRAALSEISHYFGRRSHSSVVLAQQTVNQWVSEEKSVEGRSGPINIENAIRQVELKLRTG